MVNRKLIRPSLAEISSTMKFASPGARKRVPPEQTHAENFYYVKQMNNKTPMVLRLSNGDEVRGYIEWYDRDCIKFNRENAPNLLIYKSAITYMFKEEELQSKANADDVGIYQPPRGRRRQPTGDSDGSSRND